MLIQNKLVLNKLAEDFAHVLTGYDTMSESYFTNINHTSEHKLHLRFYGLDWPRRSKSMIGVRRMLNIYELLIDVLENDIQGDFIETGVWRGGACMYVAKIFQELKITDRNIWICDSFQGLPVPDPKYIHDIGDKLHTIQELVVSLNQVKNNFIEYNLLSDQTKFVKGWFCDTLPHINAKFAIIRLDGDMYSSTIDALNNLYNKLSPGGYVIVDDYSCCKNCKAAVDDYRAEHNIMSPLIETDRFYKAVYWKK